MDLQPMMTWTFQWCIVILYMASLRVATGYIASVAAFGRVPALALSTRPRFAQELYTRSQAERKTEIDSTNQETPKEQLVVVQTSGQTPTRTGRGEDFEAVQAKLSGRSKERRWETRKEKSTAKMRKGGGTGQRKVFYEAFLKAPKRQKRHPALESYEADIIDERADINSGAKNDYFFNPNKVEKPRRSSPIPKPSSSPRRKQRTAPSRHARASHSQEGPENETFLTIDEAQRRYDASVVAGDNHNNTPSQSTVVNPSKSWQEIGINIPALLDNLRRMGCPTPLPVQIKTTKAAMEGNDVVIGTYTGSGKTLAVLAPLAQRLLESMGSTSKDHVVNAQQHNPGLAVLIVVPGRELASQIASVAREFLRDTPLQVCLAIGGTSFARNVELLRKRKPNLLVGTPGRLAELLVGNSGDKRGKVKVGSLQTLVLDEFDALIEYEPHREPTQSIMNFLKKRHKDQLQSVLCSATAMDLMDSARLTEFLRPGFVTALANKDGMWLNDHSDKDFEAVHPQMSRTTLHGAIHIPHERKAMETLTRILHTEPIPQQVLIFAENAYKVEILVEKLAKREIIAAALHGGHGSNKMDRAEVTKTLRQGYVGIVVATELAARGIDAPLLTHVVNFDLPTDASHYAHRAGRCGRGGRPGVVISMTTSPQERKVPYKFAGALGIEMHKVEARRGRLLVVDQSNSNSTAGQEEKPVLA